MPRPKCYPSSSIGLTVDISGNFLDRPETYSITWDDGFQFWDDAWFKVFHQCEPSVVLDIIQPLLRNWKHYDLILGFDERVMKLPNAKFLTESCCSWMDRRVGGDVQPLLHNFEDNNGLATLSPIVSNYQGCDVSQKKFAASFLTSSKGWLYGHKLRQKIFAYLPDSIDVGLSAGLKIHKHRSPPRIDDKRVTLEPVQFSVVAENCQQTGYYSEKIVDCFIAKTFPIYWGCPNLVELGFDPEGFLYFEDVDHLGIRLYQLTPTLYQERHAAIEHNFQHALKSVHQWTLIENYITEGINRKKQTGRAW